LIERFVIVQRFIVLLSLVHLKTLKKLFMKLLTKHPFVLIAVMLFAGITATAQKATTNDNSKTTKTVEMKTYVIEREIPGAGKLTAEQLKGISQTSCGVLKEMGPKIQWVHSYVTGNKIYCIYKAENEELVREHARKGGFPANSVSEVSAVISPATAN
jgi:BarA-like signal transduction histidine kinase